MLGKKNKQNRVKKTLLLLAIVILFLVEIGFFTGFLLGGQETNPFYIDLFNEGERSFLSSNYQNTIKELEIALFGLYQEKEMTFKAYIYMGLSHYYLNDRDNSRQNLVKAADLMRTEGFTSLDLRITPSNRNDLQKLIRDFNLNMAFGQGEPVETLGKPVEQKKPVTPPRTTIQEETIREPSKRFPEQAPLDVNTYMLMGKRNYQEERYREAEVNFEKVIDLSRSKLIEEKVLTEAKAYLVLSAHMREDRMKARRMLDESRGIFVWEKIRGLSLDILDKMKLQEIIRLYSGAQPSVELPSAAIRSEDIRFDEPRSYEPAPKPRVALERGALSDIVLRWSRNSLEVILYFEPYASHEVFEFSDINKFGIDLIDIRKIKARRRIEVNDFGIRAIRTGMYKPDITRVVFDAERRIPSYRIEKTDWGLKIVILR